MNAMLGFTPSDKCCKMYLLIGVPVVMASFEVEVTEIAAHAFDASEALSVHPPEASSRNLRWLESDHRSFHLSGAFEDLIMDRNLPRELSTTTRRIANDDLAGWRAALPYSEAERALVFDWDRFGATPELVRGLGHTTILDCGVEKEVSGRELMQRWWNWRRGMDRYAETNSAELAREALHCFAEHLSGAAILLGARAHHLQLVDQASEAPE